MSQTTSEETRAEIVARDHARLDELTRETLSRKPSQIESMLAGMGSRRFHRIFFADGLEPRTIIARLEEDGVGSPGLPILPNVPAAPAWHKEPSLEPLRGFLEQAGLPVPQSYLHRPDEGLDLLEDIGDQTLGDTSGAERERLYAEACRLIPRLQRLHADAADIPAFGRRFDPALVATKAWKWLHWTIPLILERPASPQEVAATERLFGRIAALAAEAPQRLSHRDFKAENLHLDESHHLVLIDIQGAFMAPPEYDLVCLLYDLQVDLEEDFIEACLGAIRPHLPDAPSTEQLRLRFDALAVARLCKDVSHVIHAGRVRGDLRRWHEIPRGLELLSRATARLNSEFPGTQTLTSVIQALTRRVHTTDSSGRG